MNKTLKERRLEAGFTQDYMAEQLGVSTRQYIKYESGEVEPKKSHLLALDRVLAGEKPMAFINYRESRLHKKNGNDVDFMGVPIFDVPIDASFLETFNDGKGAFDPVGFLNIPKLKNCNFAAIVSGSSMYPIMKSGTIAACRIVENLDYFDEGEMYIISTTNGFETVKYVQSGDNPDELILIPHNEKVKRRTIKKEMIIRMCIVEAWVNFR